MTTVLKALLPTGKIFYIFVGNPSEKPDPNQEVSKSVAVGSLFFTLGGSIVYQYQRNVATSSYSWVALTSGGGGDIPDPLTAQNVNVTNHLNVTGTAEFNDTVMFNDDVNVDPQHPFIAPRLVATNEVRTEQVSFGRNNDQDTLYPYISYEPTIYADHVRRRSLKFKEYDPDATGQMHRSITLTDIINHVKGSGCIVEGTLITMADGTKKPVERVASGDEVLSYDFETGEQVPAVVIFRVQGEDRKGARQNVFDDGTILETVDEHYVYSVGDDPCRDIRDMKTGNKVLKEDGSEVGYSGYYNHIDNCFHSYHLLTSNNIYYANGIMNTCFPPSKFHYASMWHIDFPEELRAAIDHELDYSRRGGRRANNKEFLAEVAKIEKQSHSLSELIRDKKAELANSDWTAIKTSEKIAKAVIEANDFFEFKQAVAEIIEQKEAADIKRREEYRKAINDVEESHAEYHRKVDALKRKYGVITDFEDSSLDEQFKICNKLGNDNIDLYRAWLQKPASELESDESTKGDENNADD